MNINKNNNNNINKEQFITSYIKLNNIQDKIKQYNINKKENTITTITDNNKNIINKLKKVKNMNYQMVMFAIKYLYYYYLFLYLIFLLFLFLSLPLYRMDLKDIIPDL